MEVFSSDGLLEKCHIITRFGYICKFLTIIEDRRENTRLLSFSCICDKKIWPKLDLKQRKCYKSFSEYPLPPHKDIEIRKTLSTPLEKSTIAATATSSTFNDVESFAKDFDQMLNHEIAAIVQTYSTKILWKNRGRSQKIDQSQIFLNII